MLVGERVDLGGSLGLHSLVVGRVDDVRDDVCDPLHLCLSKATGGEAGRPGADARRIER